MDARLSAEQVAELRRCSPQPSAKELAKQLDLSKDEAAAILADLDGLTPTWAGREESRLILIVGAILILVASLFAYSNNDEGAFVFDDVHSVQTEDVSSLRIWMNRGVREDDRAAHKLSVLRVGVDRSLNGLFRYNRFRVVTYATFSFEDWWFEGATKGQVRNGGIRSAIPGVPEPHVHWFNNWIHAINGLLVLWLAYLTFTAPAFASSRNALRYPAVGAVLAATIFSLHPLQTQAVSYISQRAESLGALFFLLSLCLFVTARRRSVAEGAGERPYLSVLAWGGVLGVCGVLILAAALSNPADLTDSNAFPFALAVKLMLATMGVGIGISVYLVKKGFDEPWHAAAVGGAVVALLLGLETKEIVGVLPAVLLAYELLFGAAPQREAPSDALLPVGPGPLQKVWLWRALRAFSTRERLRYNAPWIAAVVAVLVAFPILGGTNFSAQFLGGHVDLGGRQKVRLTPANYLLTQANVLHSYVRLTAIPVNQSVDHDYPLALAVDLPEGPTGSYAEGIGDYKKPLAPAPTSSPLTTLLSLLGLLAAIALALGFGGRGRIASFAVVLALLVLGPSSSLIVLADVIFEHRFYLPLFGAALLFPVVVERLLRSAPKVPADKAMIALALVLGVSGTMLVMARNEVWRNDLSLWTDVVEKAPKKPRGWVNLGLYWQKLETHAVKYQDSPTTTRTLLCAPRGLPGGEDIILHQYSHQVSKPTFVGLTLVQGIAELKENKGAPEKSRESYQAAIAIEPYGKALNNMAIISVYEFQHLAQERQVIRRELMPRFRERNDAPRYQACLARIEQIEGLLDKAAAEAERSLKTNLAMGRWDFFVLNNLGGLYSLTSKHSAAVYWLGAAVKLDNGASTTWAGLGEAYEKWGTTRWLHAHQGGSEEKTVWVGRAEESWRKAIEAYETFLRKSPGAPQAGYVRRSADRLRTWLKGQGRPPITANIPRTAVID
ncbi:MAG: hypothetical protein JKY65_08885 [Planctomycetes bacterium]|nr:hypothetical protein [Planctomycetota bacterium]